MSQSTTDESRLREGLLSGISVVELATGIGAPFAAQKLARLGATVIKIEPPAGDPVRSWGPFPERGPSSHGGIFEFLNGSKQSVTLDVDKESGREALNALLVDTDVLITDRPRNDFPFMQGPEPIAVGLDVDILSITPFGSTGPRADWNGYPINCDAVSGVQIALGDPDKEPLALPAELGSIQAGIQGAASVLMSIFVKEYTTTQPQVIDISTTDVLTTYVAMNSTSFVYYEGLEWERAGNRAYGSAGPYPYTILPCADGAVCLICRSSTEWQRFLDAMGNPPWADEERYSDRIAMGRKYPDEVDEKIEPWLQDYTTRELFEIAREYGFPLAPVRTIEESVQEPHLDARDFFDRIEDSVVGDVYIPGLPFEFSGTSVQTDTSPAPELGEHTLETLGQIGIEGDHLARLRQADII